MAMRISVTSLMVAGGCDASTRRILRFLSARFRRRDLCERRGTHESNAHSVFIEAADGERSSIGREARVEEGLGEPERGEFLLRGQIPKFHLSVMAGRGEGFSVWRKDDRDKGLHMALERAD